jgi:glycerol-3-phosphate acyltransferase PlsY
MVWLVTAAVALVAYLLGAVPIGLIVGLLHGIDVRQHGSRRTGATNVLRLLGWRWALLVLLGDVAKGVIAVLLARFALGGFGETPRLLGEVIAALAAVAGHNWSIYIKGHGGRGVATSIGTLAAISPITLVVSMPVGILLILLTDMVSVGSIIGTLTALAFFLIQIILGQVHPLHALYGIPAAVLIVFQHRDNIARILSGTERRIGVREKVLGRR